MNLLRYALLPVRAPMLLLLFGVSTYLGSRWSHTLDPQIFGSGLYRNLLLSVECLQALLVVVVCTIPDVLMHQLSTMMAYSRVVSLVGSLLLVIAGGLYLLHLSVFSSVLILACSVLLVRLDLAGEGCVASAQRGHCLASAYLQRPIGTLPVACRGAMART